LELAATKEVERISAAKVDVILSWVLMLTNNDSQCLRKKARASASTRLLCMEVHSL
jgi:hypothetical protein